jgi:hypothetical protein
MAFGKTVKYSMDNPKARKRHQDYQAETQKPIVRIKKRSELSNYINSHWVYKKDEEKPQINKNKQNELSTTTR